MRSAGVFVADAIVKISWRPGDPQPVGGICGTCFTLETGITLSCAHVMRGVFVPNTSYKECGVFIVERAGGVKALRERDIQLFPDYDACVINDHSAIQRYKLSTKDADQIDSCTLRGYEANTGPFQLVAVAGGYEIIKPNIKSVAQSFKGLTPTKKQCTVNANDVNISEKLCYIFDVKAEIGLSGGPMIDSATGMVAGLCFMGLPADTHEKTQIAAIDIRQFPFI